MLYDSFNLKDKVNSTGIPWLIIFSIYCVSFDHAITCYNIISCYAMLSNHNSTMVFLLYVEIKKNDLLYGKVPINGFVTINNCICFLLTNFV